MRHMYISLRGWVILLNFVLNAILIFLLSILKMCVKVWKNIVRFQRIFLWGGVRGGSKNVRVRRSDVYKPKNFGGLGVCDLQLINLTLLGKWRWKMISVI